MTNSEKYLKDGVDLEQLDKELIDYICNQGTDNPYYTYVSDFFKEQAKPTLTEDEKAILRNISKEYVKVGKTNEGLYFLSYRDCEPNVSYSYYANMFKSSLFSFIQEGDEYVIKDLLGDEKE